MLSEMSDVERDELAKAYFDAYDTDKSGTIDIKELPQLVRAMGKCPTEAEVAALLAKYDDNKDGVLNKGEFLNLLEGIMDDYRDADDDDGLLEAFEDFDRDGNGYISKEELIEALTTRGETMGKEEAERILADFDADGDGKLDYYEFVSMLTGKKSKREAHESRRASRAAPDEMATAAAKVTPVVEFDVNGDSCWDDLGPLYEEANANPTTRNMLPLDAAKAAIDAIIARGKPFLDDQFRPSAVTLNRLPVDQYPDQSVQRAEATPWYRLAVIKEDAKLFVDGTSAADIIQGGIGNCYMCGQIAAFAERQDLVTAMFYPQEKNAAGIYGLKWWIPTLKEWRMIIVDDYIPCASPDYRAPIFMQSRDEKEMWPSLCEKAFAKLNGSYQGIWAGMCLCEPGVVLSGADYAISCPKTPAQGFDTIRYYLERRGFVSTGSGRSNEDGSYVTVTREEGLVQGHAYSVLKAVEHDGFKLLQVRNTWGSFEWNGDWSDKSSKWTEHPAMKEKCGWTDADDGTFWMSAHDFWQRFGGLELFALGFDHVPEASVCEDQYSWMIEKMRPAGARLEGRVEEIIKSEGGFDSAYNLAQSVQFTFTLSEPLTLRFMAERAPAEKADGAEKGGSASMYLLKKPTTNPAGRGLCLAWLGETEEEQYSETIIAKSFIDWSPDVSLEAGEYTLVPYVHNNATYPVVVSVKAENPPMLKRCPRLRFKTARSAFSDKGGRDANGDDLGGCPQFLLTVKQTDELIIEGTLEKSFKAFFSNEWLTLMVTPEGFTERLENLEAVYDSDRDVSLECMNAHSSHVGGRCVFEPGQYVVILGFQDDKMPAVELKVTSFNGNPDTYDVEAL